MKFKLAIIIIISFLISGWFYWFQLRPVEIRKKCHSDAEWNALRALGWRGEDSGFRINHY